MEQLRQQQEQKVHGLRKKYEDQLAQLAAQHSQQLKATQDQYTAEVGIGIYRGEWVFVVLAVKFENPNFPLPNLWKSRVSHPVIITKF